MLRSCEALPCREQNRIKMQEGNCLVIAIEKKQTNNCVSKGLPVVVNRDGGGVLLPGLPVGLHGSAPAENDLNLVSLTHPERL